MVSSHQWELQKCWGRLDWALLWPEYQQLFIDIYEFFPTAVVVHTEDQAQGLVDSRGTIASLLESPSPQGSSGLGHGLQPFGNTCPLEVSTSPWPLASLPRGTFLIIWWKHDQVDHDLCLPPPFMGMGQVLVYPGVSSPDWTFPLGLFMKTKNLWDATPTPNHLFQRLHFNNLLFSFQKVRGASGGALPKRRNSKIFLGNVNSCQQFSVCVRVGGWLHMFDWEQLAVYCSTV